MSENSTSDQNDPDMFASGAIVADAKSGNAYTIKRRLGSGAFGQVYEATSKLNGAVVVKALRPEHNGNREVVRRFLQESRAAAAVQSSHIVNVWDAGTTSAGIHFLVMELLVGTSLSDLLADRGSVSEREALHIILSMCQGLAAAHAQGIVHRDLKPENVFLAEQYGHPLIKIMDFGIAHVFRANAQESRITRSDSTMGTPTYMAREQWESPPDVDHRADIYALGVMLYELLEGSLPYTGGTPTAVMVAATRDAPKPMSLVPDGLRPIIAKAMARDAKDRFQSVLAFSDALEEYGRQHSLVPEPSIMVRPSLGDDLTEVLEIPVSKERGRLPTDLAHSDIKSTPPRGHAGRSAVIVGIGVLLVATIVVGSWKRYAAHHTVPTVAVHVSPPAHVTPTPMPPPVEAPLPEAPQPPVVVPTHPPTAPPVLAAPVPSTPTSHNANQRHGSRHGHHHRTHVVGTCHPDPVTGENICD